MKVLHVSGARSWGGNEQQLIDMILALNEKKVENIVFGVKNTILHETCKQKHIQFLYSEERKLNKFKNYKFLKTLVVQYKPDVIHMHTSDSLTVFVISDLLYRLSTPAVFSKKGMGRSMSKLSIYKYNYKNLDSIFCVSGAVKKSMELEVIKRKNFNKLQVLYEGINKKRLDENSKKSISPRVDIKKDTHIIGNIANHAAAKDLKTLIKAVNFMVNEVGFKDFVLYQIGKYSKLTEELEQLINEYGINDYIILTDFIENATNLLPEFDIYVMSSEREGLPLTIYEAFYKKVPVVTTKAGGIPEVVSDAVNGFLVDIGDYEELGRKIIELVKENKIREQFANKSFDLFINEYEVDKTSDKILKAYTELI